jgi:hypothetical protein
MIMAWTSPDLEINSAVRRVLVRHWIDLGRISIRTQNGRVTLHGILDKLPESDQPLAGTVVECLFDDIRRIHGVKRVLAEIQNWDQTSFGWKLKEDSDGVIEGTVSAHGSADASRFNVDKWIKNARTEH